MQNEKFFTQVSKTRKTLHDVYRKADNKKVGSIQQRHRGWEADKGAGIRNTYATKAAAFNSFSA